MTVVTRHPEKATALKFRGAKIAELDVHDTTALHHLFQSGEQLFLLNPPAPPSCKHGEGRAKTLRSILGALEGSAIKKVVAASTYGARPGNG